MPKSAKLDVVICTYNRAKELDRVLDALAAQASPRPSDWSVLVVDNACTDETPEVVRAHQTRSKFFDLRRIVEPQQGLTYARLRGVRETSGEWIAFVDDDNVLEANWVMAILEAVQAHPSAGGIGGRVVLDWETPPPRFLDGFGFCYAEQDYGVAATEVDNLTGAGMALRRTALEACGWLERPLLADRVGKRLVSGGDVEIAQRVRAAGYALWFTPHAVLRHRIPVSRTTRGYFLKMNAGLGASDALISALTWPGNDAEWRSESRSTALRKMRWAIGEARRALRGCNTLMPALGWAALAFGFTRGMAVIASMGVERRNALLGAAAIKEPSRSHAIVPTPHRPILSGR